MNLSPQQQALFREAVALHQDGRLEQARALYYQILDTAPSNADLLRFAGTAECQLGNAEAGVNLLGRSLEMAPDQPEAHHNRGHALLKLGHAEAAVESYDRAVALRPAYASAWFSRGMALLGLKQTEAAAASFERAVAARPDFAEAWLERGNALMDIGQMEAALTCFDRALTVQPNLKEAVHHRSDALMRLGRYAEAAQAYERVVALEPGLAYAWSNHGIALMKTGRHAEALFSYDRALALEPGLAEAWSNRGDALGGLGRYEEAIASCKEALRLRPDFANAWNIKGNAEQNLRRPADALASFEHALAVTADTPEGLSNRAGALLNLRRYAEALESCDQALALSPGEVEAHKNRGGALLGLERFEEALAEFNGVLAVRPDSAEVYNNYGNALQGLNRHGEAAGCYDRALRCDPDYVEALSNLGNVLMRLDMTEEAVRAFDRLMNLRPDYPWVAGQALYNRMRLSDWSGFRERIDDITDRLRRGERPVAPFGLHAMIDDPDLHYLSAAAFGDEMRLAPRRLPPLDPPPMHDRLRIAYVSADFGEHPVTYLLAGMLEHHDRTSFETYAFSLGKGTGPWRERVIAGVEHFIDVSDMRDTAIATLMRDHQIDIAIDLNGYTEGCRTHIFAERVAPVQLQYIGFLGTMGVSFIDYIVADAVIIPPEQYDAYAEKIVSLPSFQMNDDRRQASDRAFTRAELGLPEDGFVFCCFNHNFKITPDVFDAWMRILGRVPGSVLWLYAKAPAAIRNLRAEAGRRGIEPDRLVFASNIPLEDHLARQALAGLFLDTHPYNAGATASNALGAGLPVLTRMGRSFAARMGGSLLHAVGLPELIAQSAEAYEDLAVELALDPVRMAAIRQKLADNLAVCPLFDTRRSTRHIEAAYLAMHQRFRAGLAPDHITVRDDTP
jgi:predicted O-linked N-acetylglucosamine transferase (SPINDLY family)